MQHSFPGPSDSPPMRILIVDDDQDFRMTLSIVLSNTRVTCVTAKDGMEARSILEQESFDVVISDLQMPRLNGLELLKWIREERPDQKVILMTGFSETMARPDAGQRGADAVLEKPFEIETFLDTVTAVHAPCESR